MVKKDEGSTGGPERDDLSFPPVDFDAGFFEWPPRASHESTPQWGPDPALELNESPLAKQRRAQLKTYVSIAVGIASAVCVAALVKGALANARDNSSVPRHATAAVRQASRPLPEAPPEKSPPAPRAYVATRVGASSNATGDSPTPVTPAAEPPANEEGPNAANEAPDPDPREAARQKEASQAALEHGRIAASIEAGEHAILLDPSDADAWLVLGAAYQQKGDLREARRCYKACVQRAPRGNRRECIAMLR
jgi:tetratricopeptide (TPR) repeat protein